MINNLLLVGAGSFIGGALRYLVSTIMRTQANGFPWATFMVNILGCLLIGILWGWTGRSSNLSQGWNLFLTVGFCGGFTTFSTFSKEGLGMLQTGNHAAFALYTVGSVVVGIFCVWLGYILTK